MFNNNIVIYKFVQDLHFFVTGGDDENELSLATVLQGFFDAVSLILRCSNQFLFVFVIFSFPMLLLLLMSDLRLLVS